MTPGRYLKLRRTAAGMTINDVAGRLAAEPHVDERARAQWLELVEADAQPVSLATIVALQSIYSFDLSVLVALERITQGSPETPPMICGICGCTEFDPCSVAAHGGDGCSWVAEDLCSGCSGPAAADVLEAAA